MNMIKLNYYIRKKLNFINIIIKDKCDTLKYINI